MTVIFFFTLAVSVCVGVCERERDMCYILRSLMRFLYNTFHLTDLFTAFAIHA
jgi:hypothetical protein